MMENLQVCKHEAFDQFLYGSSQEVTSLASKIKKQEVEVASDDCDVLDNLSLSGRSSSDDDCDERAMESPENEQEVEGQGEAERGAEEVPSEKEKSGDGNQVITKRDENAKPKGKETSRGRKTCRSRNDVGNRSEVMLELQGLAERATITYGHVGSRCSFKCPVCRDEFPSWWRIRVHSFESGHFPPEEIPKHLSEVVAHECKVCRERVQCDLHLLKEHLQKRHKMLLNDYCDRFDLKVVRSRGTWRHVPNAARYIVISDSVGDLCLYECKKCRRTFASPMTLKHHLDLFEHGPSSGKSLMDCMARVSFHRCRLCSHRFLNNRAHFRNHLIRMHQLTLSDYSKKFGLKLVNLRRTQKEGDLANAEESSQINDLCIFRCNHCGEEFTGVQALYVHTRREKHGPPIQYHCLREHVVKCVAHRCRLCGQLRYCDRYSLRHHFKGHGVNTLQEYCARTGCTVAAKAEAPPKKTVSTWQAKFPKLSVRVSSQVGDLCAFTCKTCGITLQSSRELRQHLKRNCGKDNVGDLKGGYQLACLSDVVLHQCRLCREFVLCDVCYLYSHLHAVHKMGIDEYSRQTGVARKQRKALLEYEEDLAAFRQLVPVLPAQKSTAFCPDDQDVFRDGLLTLSIGNLCVFACTECEFSTHSWEIFSTGHWKPRHGDGRHKANFFPELVREARFHRCLLCGFVVLCDRSFLKTHLTNKHSRKTARIRAVASFAEYEEMVDATGGVSFPTLTQFERQKREGAGQRKRKGN